MTPISKLYQIFSFKAILPELVNVPNYLHLYLSEYLLPFLHFCCCDKIHWKEQLHGERISFSS